MEKFERQDVAKSLLLYHLNKDVRNLYKDLILVAEDIVYQFELGEEVFTRLRKRILDKGNDCLRNLETGIEQFTVDLKEKEENEQV